MDRIVVRGGRPLKGSIPIGGAKNASLPLMAASLLTEETLTLSNLPHLVDITTMAHLLAELGVDIAMNGHAPNGGHAGRTFELTAGGIANTTAPYDLVRKMRASVLVLGPLLARAGAARVSLPGGCAIGTRPVDLHLSALSKMGAVIDIREGYVEATAPQGLKGANVVFPMVSVGATENALMAAVLADGETRLTNAAREPEVADLARCLVAMGADIDGIGRGTVTIRGRKALHGAHHAGVPIASRPGPMPSRRHFGRRRHLKGARFDLIVALVEVLRKAASRSRRPPMGSGSAAQRGAPGGGRHDRALPRLPTDMQPSHGPMTVARAPR